MDVGFHPIDLLRGLFGPAQVLASVCRRHRVPGAERAEDHAVVVLQYSGGAVAQVSLVNCDTVGSGPRFRWELLGERGAVEIEGTWAEARLRADTAEGRREQTFPAWWEAANRASIVAALDRVAREPATTEDARAFRANLDVVLTAYGMNA